MNNHYCRCCSSVHNYIADHLDPGNSLGEERARGRRPSLKWAREVLAMCREVFGPGYYPTEAEILTYLRSLPV